MVGPPVDFQALNVDVKNHKALALLASLHARAFEGRDEKTWHAKDFEKFLNSPGFEAFIYHSAKQPVAFALVRIVCDEAELITVGVDPVFQRNGHAKRVLAHLTGHLKLRGVESLFLEVREDNYSAMTLYEACGFIKSGERRAYYQTLSGVKYDAYLFSLNF